MAARSSPLNTVPVTVSLMTGMVSPLQLRLIVEQPLGRLLHLMELLIIDIDDLVPQLWSPVGVDQPRLVDRFSQALAILRPETTDKDALILEEARPANKRMRVARHQLFAIRHLKQSGLRHPPFTGVAIYFGVWRKPGAPEVGSRKTDLGGVAVH